MIVYKVNVIDALKSAGYNSTVILRQNLVSQSAMQKLRRGEMVGVKTLETLCRLLHMQPGDIIKFVDK